MSPLITGRRGMLFTSLFMYVHINFTVKLINPFCAGTVFIRQILRYKDGPGTERIKQLGL